MKRFSAFLMICLLAVSVMQPGLASQANTPNAAQGAGTDSISQEDLNTIQAAGVNDPSAKGQPWEFSLLTDWEVISQITLGQGGGMGQGNGNFTPPDGAALPDGNGQRPQGAAGNGAGGQAPQGNGTASNTAPADGRNGEQQNQGRMMGMRGALAAIVITAADSVSNPADGCAAACQSMSDAAAALGYGAITVTSDNLSEKQAEYQTLLGVSGGRSILAIVLIMNGPIENAPNVPQQ